MTLTLPTSTISQPPPLLISLPIQAIIHKDFTNTTILSSKTLPNTISSSSSTPTFNPLLSLFLNSTSNSYTSSSSDLFSEQDRVSLTKPLIIQLLADLQHKNNASKECEALRAEIAKLRAENRDLRNANDYLQNKLNAECSYTKFQQEVAENTEGEGHLGR
ncbi:hypothetical protein RUND412_007571 [Rhizina undulata]